MPNYAGLATKKRELIRKALDGSLFVAPATATPITTLTTRVAPNATAGTPEVIDLTPLPTGYDDGGLMTDEGIRFSRSAESEDVTSFGSTEPSRSDVSTDVMTVQVDFQELSKVTLGLYTGADLSAITPTASGEVSISKPARPKSKYYRLLALAVDDSDDGEIYVAKFFPRGKTTQYADQAFAKGGNAINWGMTFQSYVDDDLGYSQKDFFGGPGWKALLTEMGFPAASA